MTQHIDPCDTARNNVLAAALALQQCTKTAANIIPIPGTGRFVAIGTRAEVARLLELDAAAATTQASTAQAESTPREAELLQALRKAAGLLRAAGFTMTGTATTQIMAAINAAAACIVPPPGWQCTRPAGHGGPCAAIPAATVAQGEQADGGAAKPLTRCAAGRDGECSHAHCPQLRDNEPATSARHCPLDNHHEADT